MTDRSEQDKMDGLAYLSGFIGREFVDSPSPFGRWLKGKVVSVEPTSLAFEFAVRDEMRNVVGHLHGGAIAGICDDMIGATVLVCGLYTRYVSANLAVQFFRPVAEATIIARTQIVSSGKRLATLECNIEDADRRLLAKASSQMMNLDA